jgi:hypothetical protein
VGKAQKEKKKFHGGGSTKKWKRKSHGEGSTKKKKERKKRKDFQPLNERLTPITINLGSSTS